MLGNEAGQMLLRTACHATCRVVEEPPTGAQAVKEQAYCLEMRLYNYCQVPFMPPASLLQSMMRSLTILLE